MSKEATPTRAQLSCYIALEKDRDSLAVDFAVWGPHADRREKIRAMEGLRWDLDGKMVPLVMYGPPTLAEWLKPYKVFRTCAIICGHVSPEMLDRYAEKITALANGHPAYLWPLVYQTDVHARSEQLDATGRRLRTEKEDADADGVRHPYDPEKPWERAWHDLTVSEKDFWYTEFERPAFLIMTKVSELGYALSGDAPTAHGPVMSTASSSTSPSVPDAPPLQRERPPKRAVESPPVLAIEDVARPWKKTNHQGTKLCGGFQHGKCTKAVGGRCSKDKNCAHQCAICLDNRHGAMQCPLKSSEGKAAGGGRAARRGKKRKASA